MLKTKICAAVSLVAASAVISLSAAPGQAASITVNTSEGITYNLQTVEGTYNSLLEQLTAQDWFGNQSLAAELAELSGTQFNQFFALGSTGGPFFAWCGGLGDGTGTCPFGAVATPQQIGAARFLDNNTVAPGFGLGSTTDTTYIIGTGSATAVPTPALLPGLIGIGLDIVRRKRKQKAVA
ncbi:PTPA-CTERM sorting domain-containing protein [filamentous cyanobacterium LEGE 11480]|uniref:PTPA-CTERM sorting domain-containing protein n=2 Tax=Romeriopsis TaxID=2992131 RepID=A0A928VVM2_9CYAN|nr:PTPA-CTERM sorting domain-containing protein [Romeriopsis navalis LEGE 11480]